MEKRRAFVLTANFLFFSAYRDLLPENVFQMQICFLLSNLTMMLNSVHPLWLYLKEQILRENQGKLSRIVLIDTPKIVYNSSSKGNALEIQGGWSSTAPEGSACSIHDFLFVELFFAQLQCVSSTGSDSAMCSEKPQHERSPYLQGAPSIQNSDNLDTIKIKIMHHAH